MLLVKNTADEAMWATRFDHEWIFQECSRGASHARGGRMGHRYGVLVLARYDFYTTTLDITAPDGSTSDPLLDGDDCKSWSVPIELDESNRFVTVTLGDGRRKVVHW